MQKSRLQNLSRASSAILRKVNVKSIMTRHDAIVRNIYVFGFICFSRSYCSLLSCSGVWEIKFQSMRKKHLRPLFQLIIIGERNELTS